MIERVFEYQGDNEALALHDIECMLANARLNTVSITCISSTKADDLPDDWFDDYNFLIKVIIETELPEEKIDQLLETIHLYPIEDELKED